MNAENSDPHEEGLQRLAQLGSLLTSAAEAGVRIASMRRRRPAAVISEAQPQTRRTELPSEAVSVASPAPPSTSSTSSTQAASALASAQGPARNVATVSLRREHEDLYAVHQEALAFYRASVSNSWVPEYLTSRRLEVALEPPWSAGYAPAGWTTLTDHLRSRGWCDEVLVAAGLSRPARTGNLIDQFRDRLVLPIRVRDDVVGFVARCAEGADNRTPKYLNSPSSAIYDKSAILYAARDPRDVRWWGATPVLVEGPLDAIAVSSCAGDRWAGVALCGTAMSEEHVAALIGASRRASPEVIVATDHDRAGQAAAETALRRLAPSCGDLHRLQLPQGQDPADVLRQDGADALGALLTSGRTPLFASVLDTRLKRWDGELQWVDGRVRAARHVAPVIAALPEAERPAASRQLAERLDLLESTVEDAVRQAASALTRRSYPSQPSTSGRGAEMRQPGSQPPRASRGR